MSGNRASEHGPVREARLRIVHAIVHAANRCSAASIIEECVCRGDWPEANWANARKGPPDAQQVNNYLNTLLTQKKVRRESHGVYVSLVEPEPAGGTMRRRAAEALRLQSEGLSGKQIAEHMEISNSLAYGLINDPYGDKERERKKMYCPVCGAKKEGSVDWCRKCKTGKLQDLLPPKDFLRFVHRAERQGLEVVFGVTPDAVRVIRIGTGRGIIEHKLGSYESWDEAVEKVGLV